jgi:hypothetical protein
VGEEEERVVVAQYLRITICFPGREQQDPRRRGAAHEGLQAGRRLPQLEEGAVERFDDCHQVFGRQRVGDTRQTPTNAQRVLVDAGWKEPNCDCSGPRRKGWQGSTALFLDVHAGDRA